MNKVLPGLFLGNYRDSKDVAQLHRHRITHILAIHDDPKRLFQCMLINRDKEYLCIMASDSPCQNLSQYFSASNDFIHSGRKIHGGNVLVHCLAGMSRSVTLAIAYVMSISLFPLGDAEKIIRGARPVSNPNSGFMKQLQDFEASSRLYDERRRMAENYPGAGGLFLESDMEYCQKHLANYNQRLTLQHPIKTSPRRIIPPTPSPAQSPRNVSRYARCESAIDGSSRQRGSPRTPKASSTPSTPSLVGRREGPRRESSPPAPWERHYGSWKEQLRMDSLNSSATPPPSPVHYRVTRMPQRTPSVTSMASFPSVASLPAHLTSGRETPLAIRRPSVNSVIEPLQVVDSSPRRSSERRVRRKLPQPRYKSPGRSPEPGQRWAPNATAEEEDETLAVVILEDSSSQAAHWSGSSPGPSSSTNQRRPSEPRHEHKLVKEKPSLTARATLGISRWVLKRSGFRVTLHSSRPDLT